MTKLFTTTFLLALLMTSSAHAALILNFSQSNATIAVGQSIDVDLVLTQSGPVTGTDISTNGLVAVDVQLSLNTTAASVITIIPGPGFENSLFGSVPATPLMSIQSIDGAIGVRSLPGSPTSIVLGTFRFLGNSIGTTVATTLNTSFTEFVFATDPIPNSDIDGLIFGAESFTLNVTAVPEPSCMIMLGATMCFAITMKLGRRRLSSRSWR